MLTPAASDVSSTFYKIGSTITFSWSYTSVQVKPTAVKVEAYCATNKSFLNPRNADFLDFIILLPRIYRLIKRECYGIPQHTMQMQHNLYSRSIPRDCGKLILGQCIHCTYMTRIEVLLQSHPLDILALFLDMPLAFTSHNHIPRYLVYFFNLWKLM